MTSDRFDELFGALNRRSPFHPFTVELIGGHRFEVDHPQAMVVRDGVAVYLRPGGAPVWFDHKSVTQIDVIYFAPLGLEFFLRHRTQGDAALALG